MADLSGGSSRSVGFFFLSIAAFCHGLPRKIRVGIVAIFSNENVKTHHSPRSGVSVISRASTFATHDFTRGLSPDMAALFPDCGL